MPFTVSHIAAVLPAHKPLRRWGLLSAAIIGSMVPDFGFLSPWALARSQTHSSMGLLTFCLPVGLVAWVLFQVLIKPAWWEVLPGRWRYRLRAEHPQARFGRWRTWLGAMVVILLGAATHLVWDGFTHEGGRGVRMLPALDEYGPQLAGHALRYYRWLQHGSSVVGLAIVIAVAWRWMQGAKPGDARPANELSAAERHAWLAAYVLVPAAWFAADLALGLHHPRPAMRASEVLTHMIYLSMSSAGGALLLVSAAIRVRVGRELRRGP